LYENCLVNTVGYPTVPWLQRIVISLEMVRVEELNAVMPLLRPCVIGAMRKSISQAHLRKSQGSRCGKKPIDPQLDNFLNRDILASTASQN
jgi:hypothetical protein